jgi:hypothetical protein
MPSLEAYMIIALVLTACVILGVVLSKSRHSSAAAGAQVESAYPNVKGTFQGLADWYEFNVDKSITNGGPIINYKQNTQLVFTEQTGT